MKINFRFPIIKKRSFLPYSLFLSLIISATPCIQAGMISGTLQCGTKTISGNSRIQIGLIGLQRHYQQIATVSPVARTLRIPLPDETFRFGEVYGFPNPVRNGAKQTIHIEVGIADSIQLRFYDVAGELIKEQRISGLPQAVDDGHGVEYAYETVWSDGIPSGTYLCTVLAHKGNATDLKRTIKLAVIR